MDTILQIIKNHPIYLAPVAFIFIWIGAGIIWNDVVRRIRSNNGLATATFNNILGRTLRFMFKEDKEPLYVKNAKGEPTDELKYPKLKHLLVWRNTYFLGYGLSFILGFMESDAAVWVFIATTLFAFLRTSKIFDERHKILTRMFEVASSNLAYPREADLNPWGWIQITNWNKLVEPGAIHVHYPARFKSDEPNLRRKFESHFNSTITDENTWVYEWRGAKSMVTATPVPPLPTFVTYKGSGHTEWNKIPLGVVAGGEAYWDVSVAPMALITGTTGGGKSTIQRNIIFHCIQFPDRWRFLGIDVKRVELSGFRKYEPVVMGIATDVAEGVEIIRYAKEEMENRYTEMEKHGVTHFKDLPEQTYALMIMIDETFMFLSPSGIKTDEGKEEDELKGEASKLCGDIARLGRAAGVHMVMATQRPDAKVIYGEMKQNLACRVAAGRADSIASQMTLDNEEATRLPAIKGRGYIQTFGEGEPFQGYFAPTKWIDKWESKDYKWLKAWADENRDLDEMIDESDFTPVKKKKVKAKKQKKSKNGESDDSSNISLKKEDIIVSKPKDTKVKKKKLSLLDKAKAFNEKHATDDSFATHKEIEKELTEQNSEILNTPSHEDLLLPESSSHVNLASLDEEIASASFEGVIDEYQDGLYAEELKNEDCENVDPKPLDSFSNLSESFTTPIPEDLFSGFDIDLDDKQEVEESQMLFHNILGDDSEIDESSSANKRAEDTLLPKANNVPPAPPRRPTVPPLPPKRSNHSTPNSRLSERKPEVPESKARTNIPIPPRPRLK